MYLFQFDSRVYDPREKINDMEDFTNTVIQSLGITRKPMEMFMEVMMDVKLDLKG